MCFAPQRRALVNISTCKSAPRPSVFNTFDFEMCFAPQRRALFWHLSFQKCSDPGVFCIVLCILSWKCASCHNSINFDISSSKSAPTWCAFYILTWKCASRHNGVHLSTSQLAKVLRDRQFLTLLTSKCASRHSGVHFFDISASKSAPTLACFVLFCAFWVGNVLRATTASISTSQVPKVLRPGVLSTFWLGNVLRATTAYTFSTSQLPKVLQEWCVLYILTWKSASRHNSVHFFDISTSKSRLRPSLFCTFVWLRNVLRATTACNFSSLIWPDGSAPAALASLLFDPPEPHCATNRWKTQCFDTLLPFRAPASSFLWLFLFSDLHFSSPPTSAFSSVHIVGSLTSKLLSIIVRVYIYII